MENKRTHLIFTSFWLKIIAMVTMTFDHVGYVLASSGYAANWFVVLYTIFRFIGRLSLPLYCFMICEGAIHTKKAWKYFLRLGIMAIAISLALFIGTDVMGIKGLTLQGNIFIDLLLGAVSVYCLNNKRWYIKILSILPFIYSAASFYAKCNEFAGGPYFDAMPYFLRMQYDWYSLLMIVLFYVAYLITNLFLKSHSEKTGLDVEVLKGSTLERNAINLISVGMIFIATISYFLSSLALPIECVFWNSDIQNIAILSGAFLLFYNGRRGYNAKWFQYGSYLYYPVHIGIIFGIAMLVMALA